MTHSYLVFKYLGRHKLRLTMMLLAVFAAFVLFGIFRSVMESLSADRVGSNAGEVNRMLVLPKRSLEQLPLSYFNRLSAQKDVRLASYAAWFDGQYGPGYNSVTSYAVHAETYLEVHPEYSVVEGSLDGWKKNRIGMLVGRYYAQRWGWRVGQHITMASGLWPRRDRSRVWEFEISGIVDHAGADADTNFALIHYDAFNEARAFERDTIGWMVFLPQQNANADAVAAQVDRQFVNSSTETHTILERAYLQTFVKQFGNISAIAAMVLSAAFAMVLMVIGNTFAVAARERNREIAVMRATGFSASRIGGLFLGEALGVLVLPALLGLSLASSILSGAGQLVPFLPALSVSRQTVVLGVVVVLVLGVLVSFVPAWRAARMQVAPSLAGI